MFVPHPAAQWRQKLIELAKPAHRFAPQTRPSGPKKGSDSDRFNVDHGQTTKHSHVSPVSPACVNLSSVTDSAVQIRSQFAQSVGQEVVDSATLHVIAATE